MLENKKTETWGNIMNARQILLGCALIAFALPGWAAEPVAADEPPPCTRVLILSSKTMDPNEYYPKLMRDWADRFVRLLHEDGDVPLDHFDRLAEWDTPDATPPIRSCTIENVRAVFGKLAEQLRPQDQFVFILFGYNTITEPVPEFCLVGPDIKSPELTDLINALPTRHVVILNLSCGGGNFLKDYAQPGRVVVSAAGTPGQGGHMYFPEFLLMAYEEQRADDDADGLVTVLEAFNWSAAECVKWYHSQFAYDPEQQTGLVPNPRTKVRIYGKENFDLFHKFYGGTGYEEKVELAPGTLETREWWMRVRRLAKEFASLEDRGEKTGFLHYKGLQHCFLEGKPDEQGAVSARTVMGVPERLPEP